MKRFCALLLICAAPALAQDASGSWALDFGTRPHLQDDAFGLAARNEDVAGEHGWIRVDANGDFVRGDGTPIRFWCVTSYVQVKRPIEGLRSHARSLAVRGVNMVRHHGHLNPRKPGRPIEAVFEDEVDGIQRLVAIAKQEGIYVTYSPYWANTAREVAASWKLAGHAGGPPWGMLFFDEKLQSAYKAWVREVLLRPNPHDAKRTPLAKDPALAIFQIQNEDSLLFATAQWYRGEKLERMNALYRAWRAKKKLPAGPPLELRFAKLDRASQNRRESMQFLAETMRAWNAEVERFLREEIGYRGLINAGNWKTADNFHLLDHERWSYGANQVDAVNRYVMSGGHVNLRDKARAGYRIEPGDLIGDRAPLRALETLPFSVRQVAGRPFLITESGWVAPSSYRAEGPLAVAAYSALHRIDGFYWFRMHYADYDQRLEKWGSAPPELLGGWPAAALMFRRGDVKPGAPVVREARTRERMFALAPPALPEAPGFDPNRDRAPARGQPRGVVDPLAYFVGPSLVELDARRDALDLADVAPFIDRARSRVRSNTGEIELDWASGVLTVNTPRARGATGSLAERSPLVLGDVTVESKSAYGSVIVVSLDDVPLAQSGRVLVQVTTRSHPTGWRVEPVPLGSLPNMPGFSGGRLLDPGKPPWRVIRSDVHVRIANPRLNRARRFDPFLSAGASVQVVRDNGAVEVAPPGDSMYVVLEAAQR